MALGHSPKIITDSLVLYYDTSNLGKSYLGEPTTNLAYNNGVTGSQYLAGYSTWTNSGTWTLNDNETDIPPPSISYASKLPTNLRIISGLTLTVGSQHFGFGITTMSPSTVYTISVWFRQNRAGSSQPYFRTNVNNNSLGNFSYNGDTNSANWPINQWIRIICTATTQANENGGFLSNYIGNAVGDKVWYYGYQVEQKSYATSLVAGVRSATTNLETVSTPTWNQSAATASGGTLTFTSGSYNSKGTWDLYKQYTGLSTATNYTWSALVKLGTASNLLVTMNNTLAWNTGPSIQITSGQLSTTEFRRISITGTTSSGSFNLHLGASNNTELTSTVQSAGTIFIQDVRLELTGSQSSLMDLTDNNSIAATSLTYSSDGTFSFNGSSNYLSLTDVTFKTSGGWTVESWFKLSDVQSGNLYNFIGSNTITYNSWYWTVFQSKLALWNMSPGGWYYGSTTILPNVWYQAVLVCNDAGTGYQFYLNGVAEGGTHVSYSWNALYSGLKIGYIGRGDTTNGRYLYGSYPVARVYSRALTSAEVKQNFNALRRRYGI